MQKFVMPYGLGEISFSIDDAYPADLILPYQADALQQPSTAVTESLNNPLDFDIEDFLPASGIGMTAAIAINDKTRPVPHSTLLPPLLAWLEKAGFDKESISFYIASGTHIPMPSEEFHLILPEEITNYYKIYRTRL